MPEAATLQVDFYVLPSSDPAARVAFACKLADKAWRLGHRIILRCASDAQRQAVSEQLWQVRPEAFIPHMFAEDAAEASVVLATGPLASTHHDLLVNLCDTVPGEQPGVARLAEVVLDEPAIRQAARERFRFYREQGYALQNHSLSRF